jgi:hypothetical protein
VRRFATLLVLVGAAVAALGAGGASASNECRGLQVCISVAGPWVATPATGTPRPRTEFQMSCPRRFVIGGLDAELSHRAIDVDFSGRLGSPVAPGITTTATAVFGARYVGRGAAAPSFQPRLGCVPASGGGGGGIPTARRVFPPGQPSQRRVRTYELHPGTRTLTMRCAAGERLVAASHAVGFYTARPPAASLVRSVRARHALHGNAVVVRVRTGTLQGTRTVLQVAAVCAGGR